MSDKQPKDTTISCPSTAIPIVLAIVFFLLAAGMTIAYFLKKSSCPVDVCPANKECCPTGKICQGNTAISNFSTIHPPEFFNGVKIIDTCADTNGRQYIVIKGQKRWIRTGEADASINAKFTNLLNLQLPCNVVQAIPAGADINLSDVAGLNF